MDILQNKGVQMVLMNLIKAAAPDLVKTVDEIALVVRDFKAQNDRIEALLIQKLGDENGARRSGIRAGKEPEKLVGGTTTIDHGPLNGVGKQTGE